MSFLGSIAKVVGAVAGFAVGGPSGAVIGAGLGSAVGGGGGGTKVAQSTATDVQTTSNVTVQNTIDTGPFADALNHISAVLAQGEASQEQLTRNQQTLVLLNTAVEAQRNDELAAAGKTLRQVGFAGLALGAVYLFFRE